MVLILLLLCFCFIINKLKYWKFGEVGRNYFFKNDKYEKYLGLGEILEIINLTFFFFDLKLFL